MRPELSVVLMADRFETIRTVVGHLRAQAGAGRIELVVVHPREVPLDVEDGETAGLWGVRAVGVDDLEPQAVARTEGIRSAAAPIVTFAETHCYPEPGWADAIVAAHREDVAAVGPSIANANPGSAISWANLLIDYGPWLEAVDAGPRADLPGHNSSYKRDILLGYGDALPRLLASEFMLHAAMRRHGHVLWLDPAVRVRHLNVSRPESWLRERFWCGRQFAAIRAREWSPARRLLFAAGAPLIPVVRAWRTVPAWRRAARAGGLPARAAPALALGLIVSAAGELAGCLGGAGDSPGRLLEIELHRERYVAA